MPISSPKSLSTVSALTPPHLRFAHGEAYSEIHSEPQREANTLAPYPHAECVCCSGGNGAGQVLTSRREPSPITVRTRFMHVGLPRLPPCALVCQRSPPLDGHAGWRPRQGYKSR